MSSQQKWKRWVKGLFAATADDPPARPHRSGRGACRPLAVDRLEDRVLLAAGALDTSFSGDGMANVAFDLGGGKNDRATAVAIQGNGKIVVAGYVQRASSGDYDFAIARLNTNGTLDGSFGGGDGKVEIAFDIGGSDNDRATAVAIDSSGRIVVAGYAQISGGDYDFALARLTATGSLDSSFDGDGKRTVPFDLGGNDNDRANAVRIQSDGRIVVAGYARRAAAGDYDFAIARLNSTGSLDTSFDGDGKRTVSFDLGGNKDDRATSLAIQSNSRIVVAGYTARNGTGDYDFALARLTSSGALDSSFDGDGKRTVAFDLGGNNNDRANAVAIQSNGSIVVAGYARRAAAGDYDFALARLTSAGALDSSFDGDGKRAVSFDLGGDDNDGATGVAIQADGRILVAGWAELNSTGDYDFAVARLTSGGSLDTSFDGDGKRTVAFDFGGTNDDTPYAVAIRPSNGRIVLAGYSRRASAGDFDFAIAQLLSS